MLLSLVNVTFIKVKSLRPKRSEAEKSQPIIYKLIRPLRYGRGNHFYIYCKQYAVISTKRSARRNLNELKYNSIRPLRYGRGD